MEVEQPVNEKYAKLAASEEDAAEDLDDEPEPLSLEYGRGLPTTKALDAVGDDLHRGTERSRLRWLHATLLPDDGMSIGGHLIMAGDHVKLIKFLLLTFGCIAAVHALAPRITDDRDATLTLRQLWAFDGGAIALDCAAFFTVGRLWRQHGVDRAAWVLPAAVANAYFLSFEHVPFLQNTVTLYAMHCVWPWQLWAFVAVLVPTIGAVVLWHFRWAVGERLLLAKAVEMALCALVFVAPRAPSPYFHFHHWFAGFLLGMHCNVDAWWSRAAMAYCWGMYVNGIAVWGRDPVLTCEYAYFLSVGQGCPYTQCYLDGLADQEAHPGNATVEEMVPVDWRNCLATTGYQP